MNADDVRWHSGSAPALDVPSAIALVRDAREWTVLLTVVDSTPGVARLPSVVPLLRELGATFSVVGDDVAVPGAVFSTLVEGDELLNGFDEVWLCDRVPRAAKPPGLQLTSDRPLPSGVPTAHLAWMRAEGVVAGLGDGDGLHFVTTDASLAAVWAR